jgi:hypothetical protein
MAAPVWVLSVDLQTKTATFQSGLAEAAKSARGAFTDIKGGANEMGQEIGYSTGEARHSVMMLGEEFGVHLPRSLTSFISGLGPIGPALEAAFPFLAIILGATLLIEHLAKLKEAGHKLTEDQEQFGLTAQKVFNSLGDKALEAQKKIDELRGNHVAALKDELELIDHQSMEELATEFDVLAKAADKSFADIKSHWYTFGAGAEGAKNSLEMFQGQYETLLAKRDKDGAHALLEAKLEREKGILEAQTLADANKGSTNLAGFQSGDHTKFMEGYNVLKQIGVGYTKNEIAAQETLVQALRDTLTVEQAVSDEAKKKSTGARLTEAKSGGKDAAERAKALAEAQQKAVDLEGGIIKTANEQMAEAVAQGWREQIKAADDGSTAKLAIIDAALADEYAQGMESNSAYRSLLDERVELIKQIGKEEAKEKADAGREAADNDEKIGALSIAALKQQMALEDSTRRISREQQAQEEARIANLEYELKHNALEKEIEALDQSGNAYLNQLKSLQDKEKQLYQQHEDELSAIREKPEIDSNNRLKAAYQQFTNDIASETTKMLMGRQSMAKMMESLGDEMISGLIENSIKYAMANQSQQASDARAAAASGYKYGMQYGGPAAPILAPIMAAGAFAAVLAFAGGTDRVPGTGHGDTVPSMLTPGEGVVPGGVMDGLRNVARSGGFQQKPSMTVHVHQTNHVNTIDGDGMKDTLDKHGDQLQQHFETALRRMNK